MNKSIFDVVLGSAKSLYDAGIIDSTTMHEFNVLCLPQIKSFDSEEIKSLRLKEHVSQVVFAKYLNTSESTVRQWEQGKKRPRETSLKLLNLVANKGLAILT